MYSGWGSVGHSSCAHVAGSARCGSWHNTSCWQTQDLDYRHYLDRDLHDLDDDIDRDLYDATLAQHKIPANVESRLSKWWSRLSRWSRSWSVWIWLLYNTLHRKNVRATWSRYLDQDRDRDLCAATLAHLIPANTGLIGHMCAIVSQENSTFIRSKTFHRKRFRSRHRKGS